MEPEELDAALRELQRDRDRQRQDFDRLRREYDQLAAKLRYPGTELLPYLQYQRVYDGTLTAASATLTTSEIFDTLPGALHATYLLSAYAATSSVPLVISDGSVIVAPSDALTVAIQRQRQTGPTRIEARVAVYNSAVGDYDVAVRVWRRLGMGA
jgi:hypothetical protein